MALCFESSHFLCLCTPQGASDTRPPRLPPRPRCRLLREMRPFPAETRVRTEMQEWDVSFAVSWESQQCPDPAEAEDLGKNSQVSSGSTPMPALVSPRQGQRCRHRPALGGWGGRRPLALVPTHWLFQGEPGEGLCLSEPQFPSLKNGGNQPQSTQCSEDLLAKQAPEEMFKSAICSRD